MDKNFDFAGYVTRHDIQCSDGVTIRHTAFRKNDGKIVPLVWQHDYSSPGNTLGHIELHHMDDGVWGEAYLNDTQTARDTKELIRHGDITSFSIGAKGIQKQGQDVVDGDIYEVSLVLRGANPGAKIEHVMMHSAYGDHYDDETGIIYTGQENKLLIHSDDEMEDEMSKTVGEVLDTMTQEEQDAVNKALVYGVDSLDEDELELLKNLDEDQAEAVIIIEDELDKLAEEGEVFTDEDEDGEYIVVDGDDLDDEDLVDEDDLEQSIAYHGGDTLKHNAFNGGYENVLTHSDINTIVTAAAEGKAQSLAATLHANGMHDIDLQHGLVGIDVLFPQSTSQRGIQVYNPGALNVEKIMGMFFKTPMSRIKNIFADISEESARARGYIKGNQKLDSIEEVFFRETSPGTVLRRTKIDRDDLIDIKDNGIDVVSFLQKVQYAKLQEEIVRAAFFGDGRKLTLTDGSKNPDKISEKHIRPIVKDDPLFTIKATTKDWSTLIDTVLTTFPAYQGAGKPSLFINPFDLAKLQTLKDKNGRYLYGSSMDSNQVPSVQSIAAYFRCDEVIEYREMPIGTIIIGNLSDYAFGMSKNGQIATFEQFDIDFNQEKYLIECRLSGAIQTPKSFIVVEVQEKGEADLDAIAFDSTGLKQHPTWMVNQDEDETPGAKYASKHGAKPKAAETSGGTGGPGAGSPGTGG